MDSITFFREGIKNLRTAGTLFRSSPQLCKAMVEPIDFKNARYLVELGAGDGVITKYILKNMRPDAQLISFELNPAMCDHIREDIKDERLILVEDSAEFIAQYLDKNHFPHIDNVISALPFVVLPKELADNIIKSCMRHLRHDGLFVQFHYSLLPKKIYKRIFGNIEINFVPLNMPPAFVMVCKKQG